MISKSEIALLLRSCFGSSMVMMLWIEYVAHNSAVKIGRLNIGRPARRRYIKVISDEGAERFGGALAS